MKALWAAGAPLSVRDVLDRLNRGERRPLAYTTVMTVMSRLAEKGILERARDGKGYRYRAVVPDAAGVAVREVVRDFGEAAVAQFVDEARADPKLLRRLRRLLED
jgi:predicted transcriptional regulator